jgi:hypothetical protein
MEARPWSGRVVPRCNADCVTRSGPPRQGPEERFTIRAVVDGHTRRIASINAKVEAVVYFHDFADEQAALEYAIASQRNRRNLTEQEIVRCILALDKIRTAGRPKELASSDANFGKSSEATAKLVGTNSAKVERTRRLKREAPDLLQDVLDGKKMVNGAHNKLLERKGKDPKSRPNGRAKPKAKMEVHPSFLKPSPATPSH